MMDFKALLASATSEALTQGTKGLNGTVSNVSFGKIFSQVANGLLYLVGAIAVLMIIVGGLRFVTSGGDSKAVESAKNTVTYAVIGLIVAVLALAIIRFVTSKL